MLISDAESCEHVLVEIVPVCEVCTSVRRGRMAPRGAG